jgi:hypothetical protein
MKLKQLLNETVETSIIKVDVQIVDGKEIVSDIFTVDVEKSVDSIDDSVAAPGDDVAKYKFTKSALAKIHKTAYEYKVEVDESGFSDALASGDFDDVIDLETK